MQQTTQEKKKEKMNHQEPQELEPLFLIFDQPHQPIFCVDEFLDFSTWEEDEKIKKESYHLYPKNRNDEVLNTSPQPRCFEWNNFKQCYSNLSIDLPANRLELRPVLPWQLLVDDEFQSFLEDNDKKFIIVARLGFEVCFGTVENIQDLDLKLREWFNHHIYDTSIIVDVHDFDEESKRRIRTFIVRLSPKGEESELLWKKSYLQKLD